MFLNGPASLFLVSGIDTLSVPSNGTCGAVVDETFPGPYRAQLLPTPSKHGSQP